MSINWYIIDDVLGVVPSDVKGFDNYCRRTRHPRYVAKTDFDNGITVSTIFLGLDHGIEFLPDYEPELFETMAYDRTAGSFYDDQWRYPTWEAAAEGHLAAVEIFRRRYPRLRSLP
jgi:hypothetical protein